MVIRSIPPVQWPPYPPPPSPQPRRRGAYALAVVLAVLAVALGAALIVVSVTWPSTKEVSSTPAPTVTVAAPPPAPVTMASGDAARQTCAMATAAVTRDNDLSRRYKTQGGSTPANVAAYTNELAPVYTELLAGIVPGTPPQIATAVRNLAVGVLADLDLLRRGQDRAVTTSWLARAVPQYQEACRGE